MAASVQDVLKANLVLVGVGLLSKSEEHTAFVNAVEADVVVSGTGIALGIPAIAPESGRRLTLNRDRITLELFPSRSVIEREYPTLEELGRLAQVAGFAIAKTNLSGQGLQAFGFNIELVYNQTSGDSALRYLGQRLFAPVFPGNTGQILVGGAGRLIFEDGEGRWTVTVEPRFGDEAETRVFMSLNLHIVSQKFPEEAEVKSSLEKAWHKAHSFVEHLDQKVT